MRARCVRWPSLAPLSAAAVVLINPVPAAAQLSDADIAALRKQGEAEGWTFTIGHSDATKYPLELLCGAVEPEGWRENAEFDDIIPRETLPGAYDWRDYNGVTPIRSQGGCGSCWAFGAIGAFECEIIIETGLSIDLSEQWLVSECTTAGDCDGGWHNQAFDFLRYYSSVDPCGDGGGVLEADFPYQQSNSDCGCPYDHPYWIDRWAVVGDWDGATVEQIKQAIFDHGPVGVGVHVNNAFQGYDDGVFNACDNGPINHIVVLVGWDDSQGSEGVWILRNSWGTWWGEDGYMRIEYGCNRVGFATCYVEACAGPSIGSITLQPDPVAQGADLTMTAHDVTDPDGQVMSVAFYHDTDANGRLNGEDAWLAQDDDPAGGWQVDLSTANLPMGELHVIARAKDDVSVFSAAVTGSVVITDPPCIGDANADGTVDVVDLLAVLSAWDGLGGPEDVNGDGIVDVLDLLALLSNWGPC